MNKEVSKLLPRVPFARLGELLRSSSFAVSQKAVAPWQQSEPPE